MSRIKTLIYGAGPASLVTAMRRALLVVVLAATLALAGCAQNGGGGSDGDGGADGDAGGPAETVSALDNRFDPEQAGVAAGDTVEWVNEGSNPHTVTIRAEGGSDTVHDEEIQPGAETSYTFQESGSFQVWCKYHGSPGQGMSMTVEVS